MSASSRVDLNINQDRNAGTHNVENFENGTFPALRYSCVRQAHAHHMVTGRNNPQSRILEFLTGRISIQSN